MSDSFAAIPKSRAMRIAQFSDLHCATRTLAEVDRYFAHAIERAIAAAVDAAVISGDATDHALELHAPAVDALARRLRKLAAHGRYCCSRERTPTSRRGRWSFFGLLARGIRFTWRAASRRWCSPPMGDG